MSMTNIKMKWLSALVFTSLVSATPAFAGQNSYFSFNIGSADDDLLEESDTGVKFGFGFETDQTFAFEMAFVDLGQYYYDLYSQYGITANVKLLTPPMSNFQFFVRGGIYFWTFEVDLGYATGEDTGSDPFYGVGLQYNATEKLSFIIDAESYEVSGGDVSLVTAGFSYYF